MLNPQFVAFQSITNSVMQTAQTALYGDEDAGRPAFAGAGKARQTWKPVPDSIAGIEAALVDLESKVLSTSRNSDLTGDAIAARFTTATTNTRNAIAAAVDDVLKRADDVLTVVRNAGYPARPGPDDAKQEAQLAGLKADLRMLLDPIGDGTAAAQRMCDLLEQALDAGDALSAWLLSGSDWPALYLESRGFNDQLRAWPQQVRDELVEHSPDTSRAIAIYTTISNNETGLPALEGALGYMLTGLITDIGQWRPHVADRVTPTGRVVDDSGQLAGESQADTESAQNFTY